MNKLPFLLAVLFITSIVYALPNPAAVYCTSLGYTYNIVKTTQGERGECIFSATEKCDEWAFLNGTCGNSHSYCLKNGYNIKTVSDGKNTYSYSYAVCVPKTAGQKERNVTNFITISSDTTQQTAPQGSSSTTKTLVSAVSGTSLPSSFDWRNVNGYNWMTPVKDQGSYGSCWDLAAVGVVEAKIKIEGNTPSINPDLSEQDVLSCSTSSDVSTALTYILNTGVVDEACFPYTATIQSCSNICSNWASRKVKIAEYVTAYDYKTNLIQKGPLTAYLTMSGYFDSKGIYKCDTVDRTIGHEIVLVGYNDAGGYWIAKNSWGSTWNGDGYFKIYYGNCGISPQYYVYAFSKDLVPTKLSQSVSPPSPKYYGTAITFNCRYTSVSGSPLTGASVSISINSSNSCTATYNATTGNYTCSTGLPAGSNSWYCNAELPGYQIQKGPTQTYYIYQEPTTLTVRADPPSPFYNEINSEIEIMLSADYNFTSNGVSSLVDNPTVTVYINGVPHQTLFSLNPLPGDPYLHYYYMLGLPPASFGNYTWYVTASQPNYQSRTSPTQTYVVKFYYFQSSPNLCGYYKGTSASCGSPNNFCSEDNYFPSQPCSDAQISYCWQGHCAVCGQCTGSSDTCAVVACGTTDSWTLHNNCTSPNVCTGKGTGSSNCVAPGGIGAVCYCNAMCQNGNCVGNMCVVSSVVCPATSCSGNSLCTYSGPSCTVTCTPCGTGLTCNPNYNKCMQICGKGNPCPNEQVPQMPANSSMWTVAVVLIAIAGLILAYLILREEVMLAEKAKIKKKRR